MLTKSNNLFKSNKTTNFNKQKKLILNPHAYVSYDTYDTSIRYDSYDTHHISDNSWAFTICSYNTKLFVQDTIRIAYRTILTTMLIRPKIDNHHSNHLHFHMAAYFHFHTRSPNFAWLLRSPIWGWQFVFVSCQLMSIRLYRSTLTRHVY